MNNEELYFRLCRLALADAPAGHGPSMYDTRQHREETRRALAETVKGVRHD